MSRLRHAAAHPEQSSHHCAHRKRRAGSEAGVRVWGDQAASAAREVAEHAVDEAALRLCADQRHRLVDCGVVGRREVEELICTDPQRHGGGERRPVQRRKLGQAVVQRAGVTKHTVHQLGGKRSVATAQAARALDGGGERPVGKRAIARTAQQHAVRHAARGGGRSDSEACECRENGEQIHHNERQGRHHTERVRACFF